MKREIATALIVSGIALSACQGNSASNEEVANDQMPADENVMMDNGSTAMTNTAAADVDSAFVTEAMQGDNGEVAIGNLAAGKASSKAAKDFGKMLATDHGAHKQKLAALASSAGVAITNDPAPEAKADLDKLKGLSGAAFDKEFARMMVEDHQKDIAKYEKQASSGDPQTSALAKETLPTLRKHLRIAQGL